MQGKNLLHHFPIIFTRNISHASVLGVFSPGLPSAAYIMPINIYPRPCGKGHQKQHDMLPIHQNCDFLDPLFMAFAGLKTEALGRAGNFPSLDSFKILGFKPGLFDEAKRNWAMERESIRSRMTTAMFSIKHSTIYGSFPKDLLTSQVTSFHNSSTKTNTDWVLETSQKWFLALENCKSHEQT